VSELTITTSDKNEHTLMSLTNSVHVSVMAHCEKQEKSIATW
jgi:hypothetical protein